MKNLVTLTSLVLSVIGVIIFKIWTIVSFILYLFKDRDFDWWALWVFVVSFVVLIISMGSLKKT